VGKFHADSERDCTFKGPIKLYVDDIPAQAQEVDVKNVLDNVLGITKEITFSPKKGNNQYKRATIMLEVTCSDKKLNDTWSLQMGDNNRIKITPAKLNEADRKRRTHYAATLIGLEKEIGLKEVHDLLTGLNVKEWYFNAHHELDIYFENGRDKDKAVRTPFKINDKPYTWLQDSRGQWPFRGRSMVARGNTRFRPNQQQPRHRYNNGYRGNQFNQRQQNNNYQRYPNSRYGHNNVNRNSRQNGYRRYEQQQYNVGGQYGNNRNGFRQGDSDANTRSYRGNGFNNGYQRHQQRYNANWRPDYYREQEYKGNNQGRRYNNNNANNDRYQQQYRQQGNNSG
jgi:hypothetical protein